MHKSSNEISIQNQLVIGGVTYKPVYMIKPFKFINADKFRLYSNRMALRLLRN